MRYGPCLIGSYFNIFINKFMWNLGLTEAYDKTYFNRLGCAIKRYTNESPI